MDRPIVQEHLALDRAQKFFVHEARLA
jgi:hypothetical protein